MILFLTIKYKLNISLFKMSLFDSRRNLELNKLIIMFMVFMSIKFTMSDFVEKGSFKDSLCELLAVLLTKKPQTLFFNKLTNSGTCYYS